MLKLMKQEWKIALAFLGIADDPDGTLDAAPGMDAISSPIELFTGMAFLIFTSVMLASFAIDFDMGSLSCYIQLILKSFVIVSMSFIALFVGMAVKSSKAAIITSFLLIFLTQANVGDCTMADNAVFPLVLTAVSFGFAVLSICNVENKDVL